MQEVK